MSVAEAPERPAPTREKPRRAASGTRRALAGLLACTRPKQWTKNLLVAAAPAAAGVLGHPNVLARTGLAIAAFCLLAGGTYLLNDVADVERDRRHPVKRRRPVAAGSVPVALAVAAGATLALAGLAVATTVGVELLAVAGGYLALSAAYTIALKRMAVVDIVTVAALFVVRAIAGAVAADVAVSRWFLIVVSFGSLFVVAGKRHSEHVHLGEARTTTRRTLGAYSTEYLRYVWAMASTVSVVAYCLWAFAQGPRHPDFPWFELSIVPFLLGVLRYALLIDAGSGGAPEDALLGDRALAAIALAWAATFAAGVYLGP